MAKFGMSAYDIKILLNLYEVMFKRNLPPIPACKLVALKYDVGTLHVYNLYKSKKAMIKV
jgi:hypothetical protein